MLLLVGLLPDERDREVERRGLGVPVVLPPDVFAGDEHIAPVRPRVPNENLRSWVERETEVTVTAHPIFHRHRTARAEAQEVTNVVAKSDLEDVYSNSSNALQMIRTFARHPNERVFSIVAEGNVDVGGQLDIREESRDAHEDIFLGFLEDLLAQLVAERVDLPIEFEANSPALVLLELEVVEASLTLITLVRQHRVEVEVHAPELVLVLLEDIPVSLRKGKAPAEAEHSPSHLEGVVRELEEVA